MVEVDNGLLILIVAVIVPSITVPLSIVKIFANRNNNGNVQKKTKKGIVSDAELTSLEEFKAVTAETIALKEQTITELKTKVKSLQNTINQKGKKWQEEREDEEEEEEEDPRFKQLQKNGITPEMLAARKTLIKSELSKKINPAFMNFPVFDKVINDIATDPDFEALATAFVQSSGQTGGSQNQSTLEQTVKDFL